MSNLIVVVVFCFICVQIIEVLSYLARLSGVLIDKKSMAYTLQNAVFMITRFFTLALMPILGLLVDMGVPKKEYLLLCVSATVLSAVGCIIVILVRNQFVSAFISVIKESLKGNSLLLTLAKFPLYAFKTSGVFVYIPKINYLLRSNVFWLSSFVFFTYSTSLFFVFFLGLFFPDYRVMLSQTSGVINAFSTILLTFWIEPKLSIAIEKEGVASKIESSNLILSLLLGRIVGVGVYSSVFFMLFL